MGLISSILRLGGKTLGYGRRIAKVTPEFLLGDSSEIIGQAMKSQKGSLFQKGKAGFRALESYNNAQKGNFFARSYKSLVSLPKDVMNTGKASAAAAKAAGKSSIIGATKGGFKAIAKRMPLIGAVLTVAIEAPNIIGAFKDGGFGAGMKEIGGAGVELGGMAAGAAIGSAICPGVGTIIGSIIGGLGGALLRGSTYSDKKAAAEAEAEAEAKPNGESQETNGEKFAYTEEDIADFKALGLTPIDIQQLQKEKIPAEKVIAIAHAQIEMDKAEQQLYQQAMLEHQLLDYEELGARYLQNSLLAQVNNNSHNHYQNAGLYGVPGAYSTSYYDNIWLQNPGPNNMFNPFQYNPNLDFNI